MPPKRKKKQPTQKQRQSQRQSVVVNIGKTTTTKRRRNAGRGGLPPPSHLQNLAPTFITTQQVDYVGLIGEISRLTAKVQDPVPIRNPVTPLQATLQASTTAQQMAGQRAEERRAGPTAENFQPQPSVARDTQEARQAVSGVLSDIENRVIAEVESRQAVAGVMRDIVDRVVAKNPLRPADNYYRQQLVNPADPPKMDGLGEGGGGVPVADARRAGPGRPTKDTQRAVPVSPSTAPPTLAQATQADGTPIIKKETQSKRGKREKAEGQKPITDFIKK